MHSWQLDPDHSCQIKRDYVFLIVDDRAFPKIVDTNLILISVDFVTLTTKPHLRISLFVTFDGLYKYKDINNAIDTNMAIQD